MNNYDEALNARMSRAQGETESDQGPVDLGPGERVRHGWRALGFRAKQDGVAMKAQERRGKQGAEIYKKA